jgi:peptide/nickel transport system ATP-binding protein
MVADRIAVMYLGRIVELGASEDICARPVHPYTQALLAAVPEIGRSGVRVDGEPANPLDPPSGCAFHTRCPIAVDACADKEQVLTQIGAEAARVVACFRLSDPEGDGEACESPSDWSAEADGGRQDRQGGADGGR